MSNINYKDILIDRSCVNFECKCRTRILDGVADAFKGNMERVIILSEFPPLLTYLSQTSQQFTVEVIHKATGKYSADPEELGDPYEENTISNLIQRNVKRVAENYASMEQEERSEILKGYSGNIDYWGKYLDLETSKAFDFIAMTMIVGTWTAFETLVS